MTRPFDARRMTGAVRPSPVFLLIVAVAVAGGAIAWSADVSSNLAKLGVFLLVVFGWIVSLCLHEFGHAYTAWRAGDREVELRGYLTLNPLKYSHPVLSIVLPIVFIAMGGIALPGGAVYLRAGTFSTRIQRTISAAGPAANAGCAVVLLAVVRLFGSDSAHPAFWFGLSFLAYLQIIATVLNLIPVPGTDGYGLLEPSLSYRTRQSLNQMKPWGFLLLFAILVGLPPVREAFYHLVDALFGVSGVPWRWWRYGSSLTWFWT